MFRLYQTPPVVVIAVLAVGQVLFAPLIVWQVVEGVIEPIGAGQVPHVLAGAWRNYQMFADHAKTTPLYGLWEVDEFEADGVVRPPLSSVSHAHPHFGA